MAALKQLLPPAKSSSSTFYDHSSYPWFKQRYNTPEFIKTNLIPLYNTPERLNYRPSKPQQFGDGGAFPEIHHAQYPLDLGRRKNSSSVPKTLPVTVDKHGNLTFDAIVKQNENASKIVHSQHRDLVPKILKDEEDEEEMEKQKEIDETTLETKSALEKIINVRLRSTTSQDSKFIKYRPSQQSSDSCNSGAKERIIKMVEVHVDPLNPPKFKHKRVPKGTGSPCVPVMHSPPRPVTVKDQQDWKIPPCISNWKNPKGYTIPLDKRLVVLQEVKVNDNFAKLSEALYVGEEKAREAVTMRSKLQKEISLKEKEKKEEELRALAQKARTQRTGGVVAAGGGGDFAPPLTSGRRRERRLEATDGGMGKKRKISKKVAAAAAGGGEMMYDERLFNQEKGMDSGFGSEDQYNVYDKRLFTTLSTLYRRKKTDDGPVEFEKRVDEEPDLFGLDRVFTQVNGSGGRKAMEKT